MFRIDNNSAASSLPAPAAEGTPGYFTEGNQSTGAQATVVTADFLNSVQEELLHVLNQAGVTPDKSTLTQLYDSMVALGLRSATDALKGVVELATEAEVKAGQDAGRAVTPASITKMLVPAGAIMPFAMDTPPDGWKEADSSSVSLGTGSSTTYQALFDAIGLSYTSGAGETFTVDTATDKVLDADHTLSDGDCIALRNSGGALPGGLSAETRYFVVNQASGEFQLATDPGGTPIDITSTGSGTHGYYGSFNIPDYRGQFLRGWDHGFGGSDPDADSRTDRGDGTTGDNVGTKQDDAFQGHGHEVRDGRDSGGDITVGDGLAQAGAINTDVLDPINLSGYGTVRVSTETRPKNINVMYCIKL